MHASKYLDKLASAAPFKLTVNPMHTIVMDVIKGAKDAFFQLALGYQEHVSFQL